MRQKDQIDLFYLGDDSIPAGSLTTMVTGDLYSVRIQFTPPGGNDVVGQLDLSTSGSVLSWTAFKFEGDGQTVHGERTSTGVILNGTDISVSGDIIPSYACSGLVSEFADSPDDSIEFSWLAETSDVPVKPAALSKAGLETVQSPVSGTVESCLKIELTISEARTNTYWVKDRLVVASDWAGAKSYALPNPVARSLFKLMSPPQTH